MSSSNNDIPNNQQQQQHHHPSDENTQESSQTTTDSSQRSSPNRAGRLNGMASLTQQLEASNAILQEANAEADVLFRGFTQTYPGGFSVTIDRTNVGPNAQPNVANVGTGNDEPVFSIGNIPNALRDLVETTMRSRGKKRATKEAIKRLKIIDPTRLKESERSCPICYEAFDQPKSEEETQAISSAESISLKESRDLLSDDPPIVFPADFTGTSTSEYQRLANPPTQQRNTNGSEQTEENEHIPVEMPCRHIFGRSCLLEWLKSNISCPLCRREVEAQPIQPSAIGDHNVDQSIYRSRSQLPANWSETNNLFEDPEIPFPSARRPAPRIPFFPNEFN